MQEAESRAKSTTNTGKQPITAEEVSRMDLNRIQDTLQRVNMQAGKKAEEALAIILDGALKKGISPKNALKLGDGTIEAIYAQAYNMYNQGKYQEASYIFRLLMMLDFTAPRHILGLAACMHRMKDYMNAANMYFLCATLDVNDPMPHYHSVDCYLHMQALPLAIASLETTIKVCGTRPQYAVLKERAALLKSSIDKQYADLLKEGKAVPDTKPNESSAK